MNRRSFLKTTLVAGAATLAHAALPKMKITRVRLYESPLTRPMFNQSFHVVTVETDAGITGIGEGGSPDTVRECAEMVIGEDPTRIDHCWQLMFRGRFYPAGREKLDGLGAIDTALWDIKGKALGVPLYQLLGGRARDYCECYATGFPSKGSEAETARACVEYGFRAYRTSVSEGGNGKGVFDSRKMVNQTAETARRIREAIGQDGDWAIDYHTRLDFPDAVRLSTLLEPLNPYFCEDLIRSENPGIYRQLREHVKVPIAVGEQFGARWDTNELIEQHLIDYSRVSIPNVGGLSEYQKIATLCDTHYIGLVPHFTGPISEAALVHACGAFPGPVLMEIASAYSRDFKFDIPYLPELFDFRQGKMYLNDRPGLGVTFDPKGLRMIVEITERSQPIPLFRRPDGSLTNW